MILTGKAKEDFLHWKVNNRDLSTIEVLDFEHLSEISRNALIIEWFDSVGIYISTDYVVIDDSTLAFVYSIVKYLEEGKCSKKDSWDFIERIESFDGYSTDYYADRKKATKQAIIKANEIYNEK